MSTVWHVPEARRAWFVGKNHALRASGTCHTPPVPLYPARWDAMSTPPVDSTNHPRPRGRRAFLARHGWATFVLPFAVFLLVGSLEPKPEADEVPSEQQASESDTTSFLPASPYEYYPAVYTLKIALTIAAIVVVWPGYGVFPFRVSRWSVIVGVVGVVVWVGLCHLRLERILLGSVGLDWFLDTGQRSAYDPLEQLAQNAAMAWAFLAVRFLGLVVVVAMIEEMFLRGFAMRFADDVRWSERPIGRIGMAGFAVGVVLPVLSHPGEPLAAAVWFSMVTLLSMKTRNIWDCVAAHAITNLLLGVYVVAFGQWQLM